MRVSIVLLACCGLGFGATYYVATTGNDTNPGTLARPWRTIGKAAATMIAGDSVLVRGGVYYESVIPGQSGTEQDPITCAAYDTETVAVDGSALVTGWVQDSANRYRASVNFTCDPRFVTERDPNGNHGGLVTQNGAKMQYAMEANPAVVDSPGEYYMNDSLSPPFTLYACVRDLGQGTDPNNYEMRLGRRRKGFDLDGGKDWLVVDGITFRNYNDNAIHSIGSVGCEFKRLTLHTNFITGIYLTSSSNGCVIEHCTFWDNGHGGIELASTRHDTIRKNLFVKRDLGDGCGGNGAHMWLGPVGALADSNLIESNVAFATGRDGLRGPFIAVAGSYNVIRHNSTITSGMGGIVLLDGGHDAVINNALDMSDAFHGIGVFPDAVGEGGHVITGNDFYAQDPTGRFWWNGVAYNGLAEWEAVSGQTGNIDSLPGFTDPDSENLHLAPGSACIDHATPDSAASDDFDGVLRPQGLGYDIGAFEYVGVAAKESYKPQAPSRELEPTIVRGMLFLGVDSRQHTAYRTELLDISGRKVLDLKTGTNDVSRLAPGVYFLRSAVGGQRSAVTKVLVTR